MAGASAAIRPEGGRLMRIDKRDGHPMWKANKARQAEFRQRLEMGDAEVNAMIEAQRKHRRKLIEFAARHPFLGFMRSLLELGLDSLTDLKWGRILLLVVAGYLAFTFLTYIRTIDTLCQQDESACQDVFNNIPDGG